MYLCIANFTRIGVDENASVYTADTIPSIRLSNSTAIDC